MTPRSPLTALAVTLVCLSGAGCATFSSGRKYPPPPPPPPESTAGVPLRPEPLAEPAAAPRNEPLPVQEVADPIVVAAWAEPKHLPPWGGEVQILVRVQKRGGRRYPGVEVRLATSTGTLFSKGKVLVTDSQGMTRDRLTAREAATIILNAGGTRYRFLVPLADTESQRAP
jgi:hypothetical protein